MEALGEKAPTKQVEQLSDRTIKTMNKEEILQLFEWLDFVDSHGHSLVQCQDFIDLVERATSA